MREMEGQLQGLPAYYEYFAGAADKLHGETIPSDRSNFFIYTVREPVGVVGGDHALELADPADVVEAGARRSRPAARSSSSRPSRPRPRRSSSPSWSSEAGFPPGVFNVVTGFGPDGGAPLAEHPGVDKVAFTGSTAVGSAVMTGAASHLAHVSLELGGKSPNIVFEDADLEAAANGVVAGIFAATGQTCMAGSRLLVQDSVYDELVGRVAERAASVRIGDPLSRRDRDGAGRVLRAP